MKTDLKDQALAIVIPVYRDAVVVIDADMQDPPEIIQRLVKKWQTGCEVVITIRKQRQGEHWARKVAAKIFYRLIQIISDCDLPPDSGDLCLLDRRAVDTITVYSRLPFRLWPLTGIAAAGIGFCYGVYVFFFTLVFGGRAPGYASMVMLILFWGGIQRISIGVLGEYIGHLFMEVKTDRFLSSAKP